MADAHGDGNGGPTRLLLRWQQSGDHGDFAALWDVAARLTMQTVKQVFRRASCRDTASMDEAVALVMDHLRRLPSGKVTPFKAAGSGAAYLTWLAGRRAADVLRLRRLRARRLQRLADALPLITAVADGETERDAQNRRALEDCIRQLDERSRLVLEAYLRGEPQARAAKAIGVAEGTVTRIRQRAIAELRRLLGGQGDAQ
jgi:RNA polymerase sigma factor (sigma-70 family)